MNTFFKNLAKNEFYKSIFKAPFAYVTGAILLSLFQIVTIATTGKAWGVTTAFAYWGAWIFEFLGGNVHNWVYFSSSKAQAALNGGFFNHAGSWRNIGIILGALFATFMGSQFKFKKMKSLKQSIAAILGGFLMGYGARVALGCNIGALYSSISAMSLSGWVFAIFMLVGAIIGSKMLIKYFM